MNKRRFLLTRPPHPSPVKKSITHFPSPHWLEPEFHLILTLLGLLYVAVTKTVFYGMLILFRTCILGGYYIESEYCMFFEVSHFMHRHIHMLCNKISLFQQWEAQSQHPGREWWLGEVTGKEPVHEQRGIVWGRKKECDLYWSGLRRDDNGPGSQRHILWERKTDQKGYLSWPYDRPSGCVVSGVEKLLVNPVDRFHVDLDCLHLRDSEEFIWNFSKDAHLMGPFMSRIHSRSSWF